MGNLCSPGTSALTRLVAFDYEVNPKSVTVVSQAGGLGQGIYQVTWPGLITPIRYDRVGTVYMRHTSAPPLPHELANHSIPVGTPSNHAVIKYAAVDNQVSANAITMIKMTESVGSGSYHLNVNGRRIIYKKMGTTFIKAGDHIPGTNIVAIRENQQYGEFPVDKIGRRLVGLTTSRTIDVEKQFGKLLDSSLAVVSSKIAASTVSYQEDNVNDEHEQQQQGEGEGESSNHDPDFDLA